MANITVSLPADGDSIVAANYNTPVNTIVNEINGKLDNSNIASGAAIDGAKLANSTVDTNQLADEAVTSGKIDFGTSALILYTGSGTVTTSGDTFTSWSPVETSTALFTYSSGVWTCARAGVYNINYYVVFSTTSAGTTANNEFFRSTILMPVQSVVVDAVAVRSTVWRTTATASRRFSVGQTIRVDMSVSAGLSDPISVDAAQLSIVRVL